MGSFRLPLFRSLVSVCFGINQAPFIFISTLNLYNNKFNYMKYCVKWQRIWNTYKYTRSKTASSYCRWCWCCWWNGADAIYCIVVLVVAAAPSSWWWVFHCGWWWRKHHQKMSTPFYNSAHHECCQFERANEMNKIYCRNLYEIIWKKGKEQESEKMSTQQNRLQQQQHLWNVCFQHFSEDYIAFKYRIVK